MSTKCVIGLHYLTDEEEQAIKRSIPWNLVDCEARELVRLANEVKGIATLQSCAGHVRLLKDGIFHIDHTRITFRATRERTMQILFKAVPTMEILDVSLRFFGDGTFWISIDVDPSERWRLYNLFGEYLDDDDDS